MEPQQAVQKPQSVTMAVKFLWASFALGLVKTLMDIYNSGAASQTAYVYFVMFFTFVVIGYLIFRISAGENWARIVFLVMFILGLIGMLITLPLLLAEYSRVPLSGALSLAQTGLQIYALILLFTQPGKSWFCKAPEN